MTTKIKISPKTLIWATERSGLNIDSLHDVYPKAIDWIREESEPTVKQLENFAKKIHVPFGFLFLKKPPKEKLPITFYRSNGVVIKNPPLVIKDLVNQIKTKQEWLKDFLIETNYEELGFIGSLRNFEKINPIDAAEVIRKALKLNKTWYEDTKKSNVFRYWIDKIEKNRIFIISTGYVGNNRRSVDVEVCKGFTLVDKFCPFIYINTNNLGGGRIFTLIHELVHVFVGNSIGIGYEPIHPSSQPLEKFCDSVSSEILVPTSFFKVSWNSTNDTFSEKISRLANQYHVSKLVIAKKALDSNFIEQSDFWAFYNYYTNIPFKKGVGGDYWNSKPYEVSRKFYSFVDSALKQGKILPSSAYKLTNMKANTYDNFKKNS
ncbi:ImmA/IrrE family metallo-endopeptidase [Aestuariivivens insulae]|uniref:ImmA/IrrE family metallo-endopeptidase n=1 Tax=Aestuariivivens insulae TaxID=1621988 RepID=UPI001F573C38|nr:ImmA/IrrE family metallo-endopeptidase [Aestuariivivens insulae]